MDQRGASRYERIVADVRQRIESGELTPGDKVPSTREITRQWGVAMATATKALTELRREGLVRAVPGVGTVVDVGSRPPRPKPQATGPPAAERGTEPRVGGPLRTSRPTPAPRGAPIGSSPAPTATTRRKGGGGQPLTPERIVAAAIAVADVEGLAAISMRRVANDLGAASMSLYRHVADKNDLLLRMTDAVFSQWSFSPTAPEDWRSRLELAARMLWAMFNRHPWLAPALSVTRPQPFASAIPFTEWVLTTLDGHGLDLSTIFTTHLTLFNYVRGTAINIDMEAEAEALSGMGGDEWEETQEPVLRGFLGAGRFPMFERLATDGYDFDLDHLFEFGLQRLLDGIAKILEPRP